MTIPITVSDLLDAYRKDFTLRGCRSLRSLISESNHVKRHMGDLQAEDVATRTLRDYQATRKAEGVANSTINKELANLSAAFGLAATNEVIGAVPRFPRRLRPARPRQGFFEFEDYQAIRAELPGWAADVLDFGYYSGWRRSEVTGLTWPEVDLPGQRVRLNPDRSKNKETRMIPLMAFALEAMERRIAVRVNGLDLVFHRDGRPILSTFWHNTWKEARERAGRPGLLFHDLRRSVCRNLDKGGVPRSVAMRWVGHKTESVYRTYRIVDEGEMGTAGVQLLGSISTQASARNINADWINLEPPPSNEPEPKEPEAPERGPRRRSHLRPMSRRFRW